jgi:tetratricopeptide (TPR) repeat protein
MIEPMTRQAAELNRLMIEAAARYNRGDIPGAESYCRRVLALVAEFPQAWHLLGLCQWQQGDLAGAETSITNALRLLPADAQMLHDLGNVYSGQGRWLDAARAYLQAIELRPDYADSYTNLGAVYENFGEHDDAERAYQRALSLNPRSATAAGSLAALCESGNRLEEAERFVNIALELDPEDAVSNLTRAQLDFRAGRYEAAVQRLEWLLKQPIRPRNRSLGYAQLGAAYEMLGKYDQAFAAFSASKETINPGTALPAEPGIYSLAAVKRMARHQAAIFQRMINAAGELSDDPVFLVGFPRSGTTLLDQMLSSHPGLVVLEEKESLRDLLLTFVPTDAGLERFAALTPDELGPYRDRYWRRVAESMPERPAGSLFVDKLPLNTIFMPLIARLFPRARFLFAVRDPRDVVLSCFMRAFGLNEAMRNFLSLDDTVRYYTAVMGIGIESMQRLRQAVHLIRYEALIDDIESEARRLCVFLDLPWDETMLRFQETARKRRINTPSYHQVVKPIYKSARERWRNYERELQPVLPQLQAFLEHFGYQ